ncbi:MAG TPA: lamin tail domain-containing protein, partial [Candidatus Sulfotelmatobacter sp.]|nr:lamin tail domain-containing protein [Candidatus Sulfotelmatobacter sp.]
MCQLLKTVAAVACFYLLVCLPARAQVVLNEVCADTGGAALSPGGTTADYIELFNAGTGAVDLTGWSLTDDVKVPNKYVLPAGTSLAARSNLVVWLDSAVYPGLVCTNFSLKSSGEAVGLYQGTVRKDYLKFGPQAVGMALCRVPDGDGAWSAGSLTPGRPNQALATTAFGTPFALRLNEWLADNSDGSDWVEVYNPKTNGLVALGGLVISDQTGTVTTPAIIPNTFIAAGGFLKFVCDGSTNQGDHLDIKLSSTFGETLTIYAANRLAILDRVVFGTQATDVSMGRIPDGGTNFIYFAGTNYMSPGAPNAYRPLTNIVINEILAHTDPPLEDAIELYNPTAAAVEVSGWWLSNDPDAPYKFRIPAGTTIPAGRYMVFYEQNQLNGFSSVAGFNRSGTGVAPDFTFNSAHGDSAVLNQALANGALTGVRVTKGFGPSANGVSFGRYVKSDGGVDYVAMAARTFGTDTPFSVTQFRAGTGLSNSYPLVGPLIISEVYYQPPPVISAGVTNDNSSDEFIELT